MFLPILSITPSPQYQVLLGITCPSCLLKGMNGPCWQLCSSCSSCSFCVLGQIPTWIKYSCRRSNPQCLSFPVVSPDEADPKEIAQVLMLENLLMDLIHKCHCARYHCYWFTHGVWARETEKSFLEAKSRLISQKDLYVPRLNFMNLGT